MKIIESNANLMNTYTVNMDNIHIIEEDDDPEDETRDLVILKLRFWRTGG